MDQPGPDETRPEHAGAAATAEEVNALLADFALAIDRFAWAMWRLIAPKSALRRSGELRRVLEQVRTGAGRVPVAALAAELDTLRRLVASELSAVNQLGRRLGSGQWATFAPAEIESAVDEEATRGLMGLLRGRAGQCWSKYVELSKDLSAPSIQQEVERIIREHVEQLMTPAGDNDGSSADAAGAAPVAAAGPDGAGPAGGMAAGRPAT